VGVKNALALAGGGCLAGLFGRSRRLRPAYGALSDCNAHRHAQPTAHDDLHGDHHASAHGHARHTNTNTNSHIHYRIYGDAYDNLGTTVCPERLLL
jgi:hypothetical protein